jgi:hypothetical protein
VQRHQSSDNRLRPAILLRQAKSTENIQECNSAPQARLVNDHLEYRIYLTRVVWPSSFRQIPDTFFEPAGRGFDAVAA